MLRCQRKKHSRQKIIRLEYKQQQQLSLPPPKTAPRRSSSRRAPSDPFARPALPRSSSSKQHVRSMPSAAPLPPPFPTPPTSPTPSPLSTPGKGKEKERPRSASTGSASRLWGKVRKAVNAPTPVLDHVPCQCPHIGSNPRHRLLERRVVNALINPTNWACCKSFKLCSALH